MTKQRALSLLEVVITLFMLGLALEMVASLVHQYARLTSRTEEEDRFVNAILTLDQVRAEAALAVSVTSPSGPDLTFWRPRDLISTVPTDPFAAATLEEVHYSLDGQQQWMREVHQNGSLVGSYPVLSQVDGFQCTVEPGALSLELSLRNGERLRTLSARVYRWVR